MGKYKYPIPQQEINLAKSVISFYTLYPNSTLGICSVILRFNLIEESVCFGSHLLKKYLPEFYRQHSKKERADGYLWKPGNNEIRVHHLKKTYNL